MPTSTQQAPMHAGCLHPLVGVARNLHQGMVCASALHIRAVVHAAVRQEHSSNSTSPCQHAASSMRALYGAARLHKVHQRPSHPKQVVSHVMRFQCAMYYAACGSCQAWA
jgi:hypothetical protein